MPDPVDLNSVAVTAELVKAIDYGQPFSHLELKILNRTGGPVFIAAFVPVSQLRELYALAVGDRLLLRGSWALPAATSCPMAGSTSSWRPPWSAWMPGGECFPRPPRPRWTTPTAPQ